MKKLLLFGTATLLFAIAGIYLLNYATISTVLGVISTVLSLIFAVLTIMEILSIKRISYQPKHPTTGIILLSLSSICLLAALISCIAEKGSILLTIIWLLAFCCNVAYLIVSIKNRCISARGKSK